MKESPLKNLLTPLDEHVLRTLLYYDIFRYPLNADEIYRFLGLDGVDMAAVNNSLLSLKDRRIIYQFGDFFTVGNSIALVDRRVKGNAIAEKYLLIARKKANFIAKFPFVRAVLASGSLSKGYMDDKSDIDFFIITKPQRLWIARTLLVLYKRLFLFNSHKYFCVNYFVDEAHLEIEEKNLFTATELATVLPLYGHQHYVMLQRSNQWLKNFFPNFALRSLTNVPAGHMSRIKQFTEKLLNTFFADPLERYCRHRTLARWEKHYAKSYSAEDFEVAFKSKSYASKNHPSNFQKSIMETYQEKLNGYGLGRTSTLTKEVNLMPAKLLFLESTTNT
jgi:hypothetical protein